MKKKKFGLGGIKSKRKTSKKIRDFSKKRRAKIVKKFSKKLLDKYGKYVKSIVVWGSTARDEFKHESDIDLIVLVDDTKKDFNKNKKSEIKKFVKKASKDVHEKLSPQPPWTITKFMKMVRDFAPLAYALLKDGVPVYDTGFFMTNKRLLKMGQIKATPEAAERRMRRVPKRLRKAKQVKMWLVAEDVYYAMIGAEESVMMYLGRGPPDPVKAADACREHLVQQGLLEEKYAKYLEEVVKFRKKVEHREIKEVDGEKIDEFIEKGEEFVNRFKKLLKELIIRRKAGYVQKNYKIMLKASVAALKSIDELPEDPKELPGAFKEHLIEGQKLNPVYGEVFDKVVGMKKMLNDKKVEKIPERDIHVTKEYIRRFVGNVKDIIKDKDLKSQKLPEIPDSVKKKAKKKVKKEIKKSKKKKKKKSKKKSKSKKAKPPKKTKKEKKTTKPTK